MTAMELMTCIGQVKGLGPQGYLRALDLLLEHLSQGGRR